MLTGDNLTDAQPGFDSQTHEPAVHLTLDAKGARIFRDVTRENVGKRMAILLFEKGKGEVVTAPVIRSEIGGGRVQISGRMTTAGGQRHRAAAARRLARRADGDHRGAHRSARAWAPRTSQGLRQRDRTASPRSRCSCALYYRLFGVFSTLALGVNLLLLVAVLSMLQATLTLPGIAAIALALGMAIDANVLINERVREELRGGARRRRRSTPATSAPSRPSSTRTSRR